MKFKLKSNYSPKGDQPKAIEKLFRGLESGVSDQVLLGVTGSGKTFTMANLITKLNRPTLVISHNKTLAAQLYREFKDYFPDNAVCYFVSYYDYYQPEAYIPHTDTYIEKEVDINEEIDRLRLAATSSLLERNDVIVVASVSCIYNLGSPKDYEKHVILIDKGKKYERDEIVRQLVEMQYERVKSNPERGQFIISGEVVMVNSSYANFIIKIEFDGEVVSELKRLNNVTGEKISDETSVFIYPSKHYMTNRDVFKDAFRQIDNDLARQIKALRVKGKNLEAYRLERKVRYDMEMINELGYVKGIENYSRYFDGRKPGDPPYTLLDYFGGKKDWLLFIDESHMSIPQIRGMYEGDRSRKKTLVDYGFRLPSAHDNRPLRFDEFIERIGQTVYVSATPAVWEIKRSLKNGGGIVEQLIRPTGVVDPGVVVRKCEGQIKDLVGEVAKRKKRGERALATTLTKKMAETLSNYLNEHGEEIREKFGLDEAIKVHYLHSEINTLERVDILDALRSGGYDFVVGVNLLREGLDLPEVTLVAILDADKEGFLRSETSLVQTMGRAARSTKSKVILYADKMTGSMDRAIGEVKRRRKIQTDYNKRMGITAKSIVKPLQEGLGREKREEEKKKESNFEKINLDGLTPEDKRKLIRKLNKEMRQMAKLLDFERAVEIRDYIDRVEKSLC